MPSDPISILVCDDDNQRASRWVADLQKLVTNAKVEVFGSDAFSFAFRGLYARRETARGIGANDGDQRFEQAAKRIDSADVLVLDYDLTPNAEVRKLMQEGVASELTGKSGEDFAYLARCFSGAKSVVLVNQGVQSATFDLTMQRFSHSFADVNVTEHDLVLDSLWNGSNASTYRFWSWPKLEGYPSIARKRLDLVKGRLDSKVLETLGFSGDEHYFEFSKAQLDPLGIEDPLDITFRSVAQASEWGLRGKDGALDDVERLEQIAAFAVGRWLETLILPAQNVLIDAPHVLQRYPRLLGNEVRSNADWDRIADLSKLGSELLEESLRGMTVAACEWLERPTWSLPKFYELASASLRLPIRDSATYVFCEEISRFMPIEKAREFESGVLGSATQRFVAEVEDLDYRPASRFN